MKLAALAVLSLGCRQVFGIEEARLVDAAVFETLADHDEDGDGHPDITDNCPADFNPDQSDQDMDDVGAVCDPSTLENHIAFFTPMLDATGLQVAGVVFQADHARMPIGASLALLAAIKPFRIDVHVSLKSTAMDHGLAVVIVNNATGHESSCTAAAPGANCGSQGCMLLRLPDGVASSMVFDEVGMLTRVSFETQPNGTATCLGRSTSSTEQTSATGRVVSLSTIAIRTTADIEVHDLIVYTQD